MLAKKHVENEKRLAVLNGLNVIESGTETVYDEITQLTADLCDAPICLISLVEEDRQWFKSELGLGICETSIEQSICSHAILEEDYLEVQDTQLDDRTRDNPLCMGEKPFRFYAGAILRTVNGWPLGTLCILDYEPRKLNEVQKRVLRVHAKSVTRQLEFTQALLKNAVNDQSDAASKSITLVNDAFVINARRLFESLTPREREIMGLIAGQSGNLSSKQIAKELNISHRTVDHHRASILSKMNVGSVAEIIAVSLKARLFDEVNR